MTPEHGKAEYDSFLGGRRFNGYMKQKQTIIACLVAIVTSMAALAKWDTVTSTDPMTDAVSYSIGTFGDEYAVSPYTRATPSLVVRITPQKLNAAGEVLAQHRVILILESDRIHRDGTTILARFDKEKAEEWECAASTDREAALIKDASKFIARLKKSNELKIRLETSLGSIRTLRFTTTDLTAAIEEVKKRIRATFKKTP